MKIERKKRPGALINEFLSDTVVELSAFLRMSQNSFVNYCVQSCIESIYAPYDCKPTYFVTQVRRLAKLSSSDTPLFRELAKDVFEGLTGEQTTFLRRLLDTAVGSGIVLNKELINAFKKIAKTSSPVTLDPQVEEDEETWAETWNHPFPINRLAKQPPKKK